jgi:hypothetical protein
MLLALKLALVAFSVLLSTQAARRFGHAVGGAVAGMPMIAAPISAILLVDLGAEPVRAIALATLACLPAAIAHIVTFSRAAQRFAWPVCLAMALGVYVVVAGVLAWQHWPAFAVCAIALAAPAVGLKLAPRGGGAASPVPIPRSELVLRIAAALLMAAAIIVGSASLPAAISGLLLAVPITGSVLPCFTLPRHGRAATASLMHGFVQGLHGFAVFFVVLYLALGVFGRAAAFALALLASFATAAAVQAWRRWRAGWLTSSR